MTNCYSNCYSSGCHHFRLFDLYDNILKTLETVDSSLHLEVTSEIQKELNVELNRAKAAQKARDKSTAGMGNMYEQMLQQWVTQTGNGSAVNGTAMLFPIPGGFTTDADVFRNLSDSSTMAPLPGMVRFPSALPINLIPMILRSPAISKDDLEVFKQAVFSDDILSNVIVDYSTYLATFRGKPNVSVEETYQKALKRVDLVPGLKDRVRLMVLPEYQFLQNPENEKVEKYSGTKFEPVFTLLPAQAEPEKTGPLGYAFSLATAILGLVATFIFATDMNSLNTGFMDRALAGDASVVDQVLPIVGGVLGLQFLHDLGHIVSSAVHKVKLNYPPYLIPSLQIGIFGSITNFLSFPKTRKALFDIAIAGPVFGFIASLTCFLYGLDLTAHATPEVLATFPKLPAGFFQFSFLLDELMDQFLHINNLLRTNPSTLVAIHPLLAVGISGMITNAFNFLPIGRLDGGRVVMSMMGRRSAASIAFITLLGEGISFFTSNNPLAVFWILTVVFLQRGLDLPPEDDVTPVASDSDDQNKNLLWFARLTAFSFCVALTAGMILPVPVDIVGIAGKANDGANYLQNFPPGGPGNII